MVDIVRIKKDEERKIREKCIYFNKLLIDKNMMPLKESELVHKLLDVALDNAKLDENGNIYF